MTAINTIPPSAVAMTASAARPPNESLANQTRGALPKSPDLPNAGQNIPKTGQEKETNQVTNKALEKPLKLLNEFARSYQRSLQFSVDEVSNRTVITVVNTETDEVIRQIPSEEVLALARNLETEKSAILSVLA